MFQLSVDNIAMSTRIESGGTRYLDLSDSFYLGGIENEKRQRAFAKGIKAADSSIMVRDVMVLKVSPHKGFRLEPQVLGYLELSVLRGRDFYEPCSLNVFV